MKRDDNIDDAVPYKSTNLRCINCEIDANKAINDLKIMEVNNSWIGRYMEKHTTKYRILKKNDRYYPQYKYGLFWHHYKVEDMILGPRYCHLLYSDIKRRLYTKNKYSAIRILYIIDYEAVINKKLYIQDCNKYSLMLKNLFSRWYK